MKLSKIDLNKVIAIGHQNNKLGLLIADGEEIEYLELQAPFAAYEGLKQIESTSKNKSLSPVRSNRLAEIKPVIEQKVASPKYDRKRQKLQVEVITRQVYEYDFPQDLNLQDSHC